MNKPEFEIELFAPDDAPFRARFDYQPGEDQWFDARIGVGSPGCDPSASITEVNFGNGWKSPADYPQLDFKAYEETILQLVADNDEAEAAARDEERWCER